MPLRLVLLLLLLPITFVFSQVDTLVLETDRLGFEDVKTNENLFDNQKVVSASKTLKDVSDLPFTLLIITKEEILANGYTTLVDVLKMAPGIRVSQPGSALEGETFLMRGLKGNTYTKILINGSPIKPFGVVGMPIGAQLPIRQAERIEIIYGPAAALYGADANAGVINIIIEDTNRPLFTQANLSIGTNGYTNIDVTFGGKIGRDKKVANFNFYGSATKYNTRRTVYDKEELYNPESYSFSNQYQQSPNYRADTSGIIVNDLPHESRMIGFGLSYKMLKLKAEVMNREDHSAIGLHPSAVSYFNPSNYTGERIINAEASLGKALKKFSFESKLGFLDYKMDPRSSFNYVTNTLFEVTDLVNRNSAFNPADSTFDQVLYDSLSLRVYNQYFSGVRYSFARSTDIHLDQTFSFFPSKNFEFTVGGQLNLIASVPQVNFSSIPLKYNIFGDDLQFNPKNVPFQPERFFLTEANVFAQAYLTLNKFNFIGGSQFYNHSIYGRSANPRLAIMFQPSRNLGIRAFYGKAFRTPIPFYNSNSYLISAANETPIIQTKQTLKPEETTSYEFGFRWSPNKNISSDVVFFYTKTENFISTNIVADVPFTEERDFFLGYTNFGDSRATLYGIQSSFVFQNILPDNRAYIHFNLTYSNGTEVIPTMQAAQNRVREVPLVIAKNRIFFRAFTKLSFTTDHIYMSGSGNGNNFARTTFPTIFKGVYTLDVLMRYELNRNFKIFFKFNNVFNNKYAGLNATNTPDDLLYNAQELRVFKLGMNYKMN
jgi:outer membrane receptor for ferrienterochelin and colicin